MQRLHGLVYYCQGLLRLYLVFGTGNLNFEVFVAFAYHKPSLCLLLPVHRGLGVEGELTEAHLPISK